MDLTWEFHCVSRLPRHNLLCYFTEINWCDMNVDVYGTKLQFSCFVTDSVSHRSSFVKWGFPLHECCLLHMTEMEGIYLEVTCMWESSWLGLFSYGLWAQRLENWDSIPEIVKKLFSSVSTSPLGPTQFPIQLVTAPEIKAAEAWGWPLTYI